jgi:hypothetical protein
MTADARVLVIVGVTVIASACSGHQRCSRRDRTTRHSLCEASIILRAACAQRGHDDDGDGWPNGLEAALGTESDSCDSDGDGIIDSADPCPLLRETSLPPHIAEPLQLVVDVLLEERPGIRFAAVGPAQPRMCFSGFSGPLLHRPVETWEYVELEFFGVEALRAPPEEGDSAELRVRLQPRGRGCVARFRIHFHSGEWSLERLPPGLCS